MDVMENLEILWELNTPQVSNVLCAGTTPGKLLVPFGDFATFLLEQLALPDPVWYAFVACNGEDDSGVHILAVLKNHGRPIIICKGASSLYWSYDSSLSVVPDLHPRQLHASL